MHKLHNLNYYNELLNIFDGYGKYAKELETTKNRLIEHKFWLEAKKENSSISYNHYLQEYPNGQYTNDAKKLFLERKDYEEWDRAKFINTSKSYNSYIKEYPNGIYIIQAKQKYQECLDNETWEKIQSKDTKEAYEEYLNRFKDPLHRKEALEKIDYFIDDEKAWKKAEKENSKELYELYLKNYPKGKYRDSVIKKLEEFEEEIAIWKKAQKINTSKSYNNYIKEYPNGIYIIQAKQKYQECLDNETWEKIQSKDTKEAYEEYLNRFKDPLHRKEALEKIKNYEEKEWKKALKKNTLKAFESFLNLYPNSTHKEEAVCLIEELKLWNSIKEKNRVEDVKEYLNKFPNGKFSEQASLLFIEKIIQFNDRKLIKDECEQSIDYCNIRKTSIKRFFFNISGLLIYLLMIPLAFHGYENGYYMFSSILLVIFIIPVIVVILLVITDIKKNGFKNFIEELTYKIESKIYLWRNFLLIELSDFNCSKFALRYYKNLKKFKLIKRKTLYEIFHFQVITKADTLTTNNSQIFSYIVNCLTEGIASEKEINVIRDTFKNIISAMLAVIAFEATGSILLLNSIKMPIVFSLFFLSVVLIVIIFYSKDLWKEFISKTIHVTYFKNNYLRVDVGVSSYLINMKSFDYINYSFLGGISFEVKDKKYILHIPYKSLFNELSSKYKMSTMDNS